MEADYTHVHIQEDRRHWYFRGRLAVLLAVLRTALPARPLRLLELGCGTGNVLEALGEFGEAVGMEVSDALIERAVRRGLDVRRGSLPGDLVVPAGWADVVLLLDVIEHLDDDAAALEHARMALGARGTLVITVPAYQWLYSGHDLRLGHRRRYTAPRLRELVERSGFRIRRLTYFNTLLFPAVVLRRGWKRLLGDESHDLVHAPLAVNTVLQWIFSLEGRWLPRVSFPFGTSLLVIADR